MGIVNITSDSFSDGGKFLGADAAVVHAQALMKAGAEIIDIGGESTRPGAQPVPEEEELRRVLPVVERLAGDVRFVISIDTMKPAVARAAIALGAGIINDVGGMCDPAMRAVAVETGAGVVAMHMQGTPGTMQDAPTYGDVVEEVRDFFRQTREACLRSGMNPACISFDPGIGFGKSVEHNLALLRESGSLAPAGHPLVLGASRKGFIGKVLDSSAMEDRAAPTVALTAWGRAQGVRVFRVHDVAPNLQAMRMVEALLP